MSASSPPGRFVLDGSVTLAWPLHDERNAYADAIVANATLDAKPETAAMAVGVASYRP